MFVSRDELRRDFGDTGRPGRMSEAFARHVLHIAHAHLCNGRWTLSYHARQDIVSDVIYNLTARPIRGTSNLHAFIVTCTSRAALSHIRYEARRRHIPLEMIAI